MAQQNQMLIVEQITSPSQRSVRDGNECYRLRRWPDFKRLDYQPTHVRIAVLLNRKTQNISELCANSGLQRSEVMHFLDQCQVLQYLDVVTEPPASLLPSNADAQSPSPARQMRSGLLKSIRQRLGID